ncbi:MAG: pilus assembly protein PilM [Candidatus Omnitrophica bacterium]|nr:pilus assembly protein PilM [Candidatus Omnitrophota bacterium]
MRFFPKFTRTVGREQVGIDLSGNHLKLARAAVSANRKELVRIASRDISGLSDEDIAKAVRASYGVLEAQSPEIILTMPAHLVITKNIEIPSTDPGEIREIVNLQAGRHTPYSREDIIVDYIDIGVYKQSYTRILLVIAARNVVKRQFMILERAGLKCEKVLFAPEAMAAILGRFVRMDSREVPLASIHIDEGFTDFMVISNERPAFIRSIPVGVQHLAEEAEKYQIKFIEEVKGSLEAYEGESIGKAPAMLIVTGAEQGTSGLESLLADTLRMSVKTVSYFKTPFFPEETAQKASSAKNLSFLNVVAPLVATAEMRVNLTPEELRLRKSLEERGHDLLKAGILVLSLSVLLSLILVSKVYFKSAFLKNLRAKYGHVGEEAKDLEERFSRMMTVANYFSSRGYSVEVLTELSKVTPMNLQLGDIRYEFQGKFALSGTADSMSTVFSFVELLEKSRYFKDVKTKYTTKRREGKKELVDFEIAATLEKQTDKSGDD